jgi:hypothetical protein
MPGAAHAFPLGLAAVRCGLIDKRAIMAQFQDIAATEVSLQPPKEVLSSRNLKVAR